MDPVVLFERAASGAASMVERVRPEQRCEATPCPEWDVDALVTHMIGGTVYLRGALGIESGMAHAGDGGYRDAVALVCGGAACAGCVGASVHVTGWIRVVGRRGNGGHRDGPVGPHVGLGRRHRG